MIALEIIGAAILCYAFIVALTTAIAYMQGWLDRYIFFCIIRESAVANIIVGMNVLLTYSLIS